jgi:hypothetical protein
LVRLDPLVLGAVERLAKADLRSVNAEIEVLLREALRARRVIIHATDSHSEDDSA